VTERRWHRRLAAYCAGVVSGALLLAACGGGGGDGGSQGYREPKGPASETISIKTGNYFFQPDKITTNAGVVKLQLVGSDGDHTLVFDNGKEPGFQLEVDGGQTDAKKIDLKPGKYTFYCDILGHRAQGMEGTITVK